MQDQAGEHADFKEQKLHPKLSTALALTAIPVVGKLPTHISPFGTEKVPQGAAAAAPESSQALPAVPQGCPHVLASSHCWSQDRQGSWLHFGSASPQVTCSAALSPGTTWESPATPLLCPSPALPLCHSQHHQCCTGMAGKGITAAELCANGDNVPS